MKSLAFMLVIAFGASTMAGCLVRDHHHHNRPGRTAVKEKKHGGCGPAHHWNGRACVHNGKAKGHRK